MGSRLANLLSFACVCLSALLCLLLVVCYGRRPDGCAAVTAFPAWAWLVPGMALACPAVALRRRRMALVVAAVWVCYLLLFAEELGSLGRALCTSPADRAEAHAVRVVCLNCAGGDPAAAVEALPYRPDIVLLQEAPPPDKTQEIARQLYGAQAAVASGWDTAILARGELVSSAPRPESGFVRAHLRLTSGVELVVASVRLSPPSVRFDLSSRECWREQARVRQVHREELSQVAVALRDTPRGVPVIVGGDFNAPAGDAVFRLLKPHLHDAFRQAGRGWGNTVTNEFPVLRFDQIWVSKELRAASVMAHKTRHSDHRMVICDLEVSPQP